MSVCDKAVFLGGVISIWSAQLPIDASKSVCTLGTIELFQFLNCELIKVIYSVSTFTLL